jgi:hypothetical protein
MRFVISTLICLFLPLAANARADTIDDFTLVGQGHTITYSLPASAVIQDHPHAVYLAADALATIDGVSGYSEGGQYFVLQRGLPFSITLNAPPSIFDGSLWNGSLSLQGLLVIEVTEIIPVSNPDFTHPDDLLVTFVPGNYTLILDPQFVDQPGTYMLTITPETAIPEPASLMLLAMGSLCLLGAIRCRHPGAAEIRTPANASRPHTSL